MAMSGPPPVPLRRPMTLPSASRSTFGEAGGAQHLQIRRAARVFLERRRGDFGQLDDLGDEPIVILVERGHRRFEFRIVDDALDGVSSG